MIQWLTTESLKPGPWQSGWKEHAVEAKDTDTFDKWTVDLFITTKCKRCEQRVTK
jgi:hypothetical protein